MPPRPTSSLPTMESAGGRVRSRKLFLAGGAAVQLWDGVKFVSGYSLLVDMDQDRLMVVDDGDPAGPSQHTVVADAFLNDIDQVLAAWDAASVAAREGVSSGTMVVETLMAITFYSADKSPVKPWILTIAPQLGVHRCLTQLVGGPEGRAMPPPERPVLDSIGFPPAMQLCSGVEKCLMPIAVSTAKDPMELKAPAGHLVDRWSNEVADRFDLGGACFSHLVYAGHETAAIAAIAGPGALGSFVRDVAFQRPEAKVNVASANIKQLQDFWRSYNQPDDSSVQCLIRSCLASIELERRYQQLVAMAATQGQAPVSPREVRMNRDSMSDGPSTDSEDYDTNVRNPSRRTRPPAPQPAPKPQAAPPVAKEPASRAPFGAILAGTDETPDSVYTAQESARTETSRTFARGDRVIVMSVEQIGTVVDVFPGRVRVVLDGEEVAQWVDQGLVTLYTDDDGVCGSRGGDPCAGAMSACRMN
mmetsp:Transcript_41292/g.108401  ORF Transcript_41292/g.108401 Transcript_41292/m.108401 type:complete len:474 (+) Transcript_41292:79-1500(+)